ncbi:carbohydrate ABC transporter permease [Salana multivorans]
MSRQTLGTVGKAVAIAALLLFSLFPAYWMISTALDPDAARRGATLVPDGITFAHFERVLGSGGFGLFLRNSAFVALGTVLISAFVALLAAVAVGRFTFKFRTAVLVLILVVQMVPMEALVIPLFLQARNLNMLDSLPALTVVYLAFSLPFAIWTLRGFVQAVPLEIEEAAYVDGASWGRTFWSILVPLVAPGVVATSVFAFITAWNEFIFAYTFLQDASKYTVAVGLQRFFGANTADWGPIMAASTLITIPIVIFFVAIQSKLSSGLTVGAVKG